MVTHMQGTQPWTGYLWTKASNWAVKLDSAAYLCRMPLDVMRVDTEDGHYRYSVCVASYGYMGDLMKQSERMRWVGPARYNLAGAATLFKGRNYKAKVSWLPAQTR